MKFSTILLLVGTLHLSASVFSQEQKVKINFRQSTLKEVLNEIRAQSGVDILYKDEQISKVYNINLQGERKVSEVLDACLKGTNLVYSIVDNIIVIKPNTTTQQEKVISGKVTDDKGQPVPGANVILEGYNTGTITDANGEFTMNVPDDNGVLSISFIGFKLEKVLFTVGTPVKIKMTEEVEGLDEVKVVAYGTTTRREMTGSISSIKSSEIADVPAPNISTLLQGKVAGMDVTNITGAPGGGGTNITIRGYNSLDVEAGRDFSNPLWVIDGIPMNSTTSDVTGTSLLADINPEIIESIEVLKDASAAAMYGSRAANGVIIVTTKKGQTNQKPQIDFKISQTHSILPRLPDVTIGNAERHFKYDRHASTMYPLYDPELKEYRFPSSLYESYLYRGSDNRYNGWYDPNPYRTSDLPPAYAGSVQDSLNTFYNNATNFFPVYFESGKVTNATLTTSGGTSNVNYRIGAGFYDEDGIVVGTGYKRIDVNSFVSVQATKKLAIALSINGSYGQRRRTSSGGGSVEVVPGNPYEQSTLFPGEGTDFWNTLLEHYRGVDEKNRNYRMLSSLKLDYDILDGFRFSSMLAVDYSNSVQDRFEPSYMNPFGWSNSQGNSGKLVRWLNENLLTYKKSFNQHNLDAVLGQSYQYDQTLSSAAYAMNSPSDYIKYVSKDFPTIINVGTEDFPQWVPLQGYQSDMTEKVLLSYFGRVNYNYKRKYLFSASIRADGASVFGKNNKWGYFPATSAGWVFSEESFMDWASWLDFAKLRASWGMSGKHFASPYLALGVLQAGQAYAGNPTIEPEWKTGLYNDDLTWEETEQIDLGIDLDLMNYKLSLSADYYRRNTDDLLFPVLLPGTISTGSAYNSYYLQWRNAAAISNSGAEVQITYTPIRKDDMELRFSFNAARNWNMLKSTYNNEDLTVNRHLLPGEYATNPYKIIGKKLNGIYGFETDGYYQTEDEIPTVYTSSGVSYPLNSFEQTSYSFRVGDHKYVDQNGDGTIDDNDIVYLGSALPDLTGGFTTNFRYKNVDVALNFTYQLGRDIVNMQPIRSVIGSAPILHDLNKYDYWEQEGDTNPFFPVLQDDISYFKHLEYTDRYVENVNWMKLKSFVVGYSLSDKYCNKIGVKDLRLHVSGENLFTVTNYSGTDPETVDVRSGIDHGVNYPLARKFTLGLTLKF
ncbi:MAG: SusC/RagA family TonB-linked outer membrane protein [Carboxylicivirga sp.]|nr:SusC/RagA family TonB-linked outer membrane protein [Carboxylicivirga sp.]